MNTDERIGKLQHIVNETQSLMGYGTASEPKTSGEVGVLDLIASINDTGIIFDVGAHEGEWILLMASLYPQFEYHCFEPDPISFAKLKINVERAFGKYHKIKLNNFAIATTNGIAPLYTHILGAANSSLYPLDLAHLDVEFNLETQVETKSMQTYFSEIGTDEILFLKLDIEGLEYEVIESIMPIISARKIQYIQFEYGNANIETRTFLKDFYKLLRKHFNFYRILPNDLYFCNDYRYEFECFNLANYLLERYN